MLFIRFEDFMGDLDDLAEVNLIGPFPDAHARAREMHRLESLPLGRPEFNGGYKFHAIRSGPAGADTVVAPEKVADATTIMDFYVRFHGLSDGEKEEPEVHPDQATLPI